MSTHADRAEEAVESRELDVLLVTDLVNLRWLTGFTGTSGLAAIGPSGRAFATDFRYLERAEDEVDRSFERHRAAEELLDAVAALLPERRPLRLGFDDAHVSVKTHRELGERLGARVELVGAGGLVEDLRAVKDDEEVRCIRDAAAIADEAARSVLARGLVGRTEAEVARSLEQAIRAHGAEPSFPPIVAAGPHGALPHAQPRSFETIPRETLVVFDWGAQADGYCSDCTRTFATGELPGDAVEVYEVVHRAQHAALAEVRPGPTGREVDAVARGIIEEAGHGEAFGHGLGHGVGLEVHEEPRLSKRGKSPLQAGNVVTVEPGVYLRGRFGVRIEDLVVVTESGPAMVLSSFAKDLTRVD